ncbi:MAG: hypothetical protein IKK85_06930 [Clostridia bacterium]|nr:hypothetical protein [Clostridia bacterium]
MKYYLGIDGGGTRTTAAVADENGILFKVTGKTINFYSVGYNAVRENLREIIYDINDRLGKITFEGVFIGCSALDGKADDMLIQKICGDIITANHIGMDSDVYIALKAVNTNKCPCVAICGTGSMAAGEDKNGNLHISGGWGHIVGDEGSGYAIAVNALKKCCIMCDNGESTPLLESAEKFFEVDDFRKAIDIIYSAETSKDRLAGFATNVGKLAIGGDEAAKKIVADEAVKFAKTVSILLKKVQECTVLGLYGGIFQNNALFTATFMHEIKSAYPEIKTELLDTPPEESAVNIARTLK